MGVKPTRETLIWTWRHNCSIKQEYYMDINKAEWTLDNLNNIECLDNGSNYPTLCWSNHIRLFGNVFFNKNPKYLECLIEIIKMRKIR